MAKYYGSNFGTLRGKIGDAVARKWRSLRVAAAYNPLPANPRTSAQTANRMKFAGMSETAKGFAEIVKLGLSAICAGTPLPPRCMFIHKNLNYFHFSEGSFSVDYAELTVASGSLYGAHVGTPTFLNPYEVAATITNTTGYPGTDANDKVYLAVFSPEAGFGILSDPKLRNDQDITCAVPEEWVGQRVHVWAFTVGDGDDNKGQVSDSVYLGSGTIS